MQGSYWQIMDGCTVRLWVDRWLPSLPLGYPSPGGMMLVTKDTRVTSFINPSSREWDINSLQPFLSMEEHDAILETHLGDPRRNDRLI